MQYDGRGVMLHRTTMAEIQQFQGFSVAEMPRSPWQ
jgi:hypothetical protein